MRARGCLNNLVFVGLLAVFFGLSSYFWFKFFVRGKSIATPALVGRSMADARALSSDSGLIMELDPTQERYSDEVPRGAVVWQNQRPGQLVKRGTRVIVAQSLGPLILRVPDVAGQTARAAMLQFGQLNLTPGTLAYMPRAGAPGVIATDPPIGSVVAGATPIALLVGVELPPPRWVMPDLVDRPLDATRAALEVRGLQVAQVRFEPYPGIADGTIIRQFPVPGAPVSARDAISLVVSRQDALPAEPPADAADTAAPEAQPAVPPAAPPVVPPTARPAAPPAEPPAAPPGGTR